MKVSDFLEHNQEVFLQIESGERNAFSIPCRIKEVGDLSLLLLVTDRAEKVKDVLPGTKGILSGYQGPNEFKLSVKVIESNSLPELRLLLTELDLGKQRREYVRVDVNLPVHFQVVEKGRLEAIKDEYERGLRGQREPSLIPTRFWQREREEMEKMQDSEIILIQLMLGIHQKLDRVLSLAEKNMEIPFYQARAIDLSGSGIGIVAEGKFQPGDHLELRFTLPTVPPANIEALTKVVYLSSLKVLEGGNNNYHLGLHFVHIREESRDLIIWYTFQQQRRLLRERHRFT